MKKKLSFKPTRVWALVQNGKLKNAYAPDVTRSMVRGPSFKQWQKNWGIGLVRVLVVPIK